MIPVGEIRQVIEDACGIAGIDMAVFAPGTGLCASVGAFDLSPARISSFIESGEAVGTEDGMLLFLSGTVKERLVLVLSGDDERAREFGLLVSSELKRLSRFFSPAEEPEAFFRNLILSGLPGDNTQIPDRADRAVILIKPEKKEAAKDALEAIRTLLEEEPESVAFSLDEEEFAVVKTFSDAEGGDQSLKTEAEMLLDLMETEVMTNVSVGVGRCAPELALLRRSYLEAKEALETGMLFETGRSLFFYGELGIGRLFKHLPRELCGEFLREIFGEELPEEPEEELLSTISAFLENDLNISETSRRLFIHRNTLLYRIERIERATGLDIRHFRDASNLELSLMLLRYIRRGEER